ncbi:formate dehydrogenase [beta proteobacterium AAP99]|nr:formate dehydrogenase [beta proteobacterium AAP99]
MQSQNVVARSATTTPPPQVRSAVPEVAKLIDESKCIGCKACQVACMNWNDLRDDVGENHGVYDNPRDLTPSSWTVMKFFEVQPKENDLEWLIRKDGCMHCEDPGCLKACPSPGAIIKYANGIVDFISENCIGCGYCVKGCPFNVPRISAKDNKAYKCTLCSDRVEVGLEPACVKTCPTGAITFGPKTDLVSYAEKRVSDLKERGMTQAALYNPQGVGGTHVMYVLKRGDDPTLVGLPANPKVSMAVEAWKGVGKTLALAGMLGAVVAGFFHYMRVGPVEEKLDGADASDKERV